MSDIAGMVLVHSLIHFTIKFYLFISIWISCFSPLLNFSKSPSIELSETLNVFSFYTRFYVIKIWKFFYYGFPFSVDSIISTKFDISVFFIKLSARSAPIAFHDYTHYCNDKMSRQPCHVHVNAKCPMITGVTTCQIHFQNGWKKVVNK